MRIVYLLFKKDKLFRITASISFVILLIIQYKLLLSFYEIQAKEISRTEKDKIRQAYEHAIINDKLFPGGKDIIDQYIDRNKLIEIDDFRIKDKAKFNNVLNNSIRDIVYDLKQGSKIDSLMQVIVSAIVKDPEKYRYALSLDDVSITFDGIKYITLLQEDKIIIDGDADIASSSYIITSISVSAGSPYSNKVKFTLYGHNPNHEWGVLKVIFPIILLIGISVLVILGTYISTFNNWIKQKKLNDMSLDFLDSVTHEFKTPITSISVAVKNLERETKDVNNTTIVQSIGVINRQYKRLDHLIDQAIGISKFNPNTIVRERRDLIEDIENIVYDVQLKYIDNPNVEIIFETDLEEQFATYDIFLFTTSLNNILINGVKHNNSLNKVVEVLLFETSSELQIKITDNGIGMDKSELKYAFNKFFQGKQGNRNGGLGLGLYYVDQMVKLHHWRLDMVNNPTNGTSVSIYIPK